MDRGASQSFGPGVYARMTGLTISQVRRYDRLGHLPPDEVDGAGRRWYRRRQLDRGRLLACLVATGMPVPAAARAAADRDGAAVRAHLDRVDAALTAVHAVMPAPVGRPLLRREPQEVRVVFPPARLEALGAPDALTLALRARRALADDMGVGVDALPRHARPERGFPPGPLVLVGHPVPLMAPLGTSARLVGCCLPWDASARDAPPPGWHEAVLSQEPWTVAATTDAERGADPATVAAVVDEVVAVLTGAEPWAWSTVAVAYEADLSRACLAIACRPIFGLGRPGPTPRPGHTGAVPVRRRIDDAQGRAALSTWAAARDAGSVADRTTTATAVRWSLEELAQRAPGGAVEVRVAPFGVAQCLAGSRHTRGTPPNVVEARADTWLALVTGALAWSDALVGGAVRASGTRADLSGVLPLVGG